MVITPLAPLDRYSTTFRADCNYFFSTALPRLATEVETARAEIADNQASVAANAATVATNTAITATNTANAAATVGALPYVPSQTYAAQSKAVSLVNGRVYRKISAAAGTAADPANNLIDWAIWTIAVPAQVVTAAVTTAVSGGFYVLGNTAPQAAATNYMLWSNDLDNGLFGKAGCSVAANVALDHNGDMVADKYIVNAGAATSWSGMSFTGRPVGPYTLKRKLKDAGGGSAALYFYTVEHGDNIVSFSLATGAVVSSTGPVARTPVATYLGSGWWELSIAFTITGATNFQGGLRHTGWTGDGAKAFLVGHGQLEDGLIATSDIKTFGAAVARPAGVVAPQRLLLPAPTTDAIVGYQIGNGVETNLIDTDSAPIQINTGTWTGPYFVDRPGRAATWLQAVNGVWRFV
jgi:hypothetical protein